MATGWAGDGAVQAQIDATIEDAVRRAQARLKARSGPARSHCEVCGELIPQARRAVMPGVRLCLQCQEEKDRSEVAASAYNRRGSKDSQLR